MRVTSMMVTPTRAPANDVASANISREVRSTTTTVGGGA
jgi:hypothetical protein